MSLLVELDKSAARVLTQDFDRWKMRYGRSLLRTIQDLTDYLREIGNDRLLLRWIVEASQGAIGVDPTQAAVARLRGLGDVAKPGSSRSHRGIEPWAYNSK